MAVLTTSPIIPATNEQQIKEIKEALAKPTKVSQETIKTMQQIAMIKIKKTWYPTDAK